MNTDKKQIKSSTIEKWVVSERQKLLDTPVFNILSHRSTLEAAGKSGTFYTIDAPDWVNIIALTTDQKVILVEQYRFGNEQISLEIPGGMVDKGDPDPIESAKRELAEETGYSTKKWTKLGKVAVNPAIFTNYCHLYLAEDCTLKYEQAPDEHEIIHVHTIQLPEFMQMVKTGEIDHSLVVAAVSQYILWKMDKS